jgi:alpha-aminoadipate carrier protein LysW
MSVEQRLECPECAAAVALPTDVVAGEIVQCAECGVELEVVKDGAVGLRPAPEEEEDWGE